MQIIYSEATQAFTRKCFTICENVLQKDVNIPFRSKRLLYNGYLYPLHVVAFEGSTKLGYFNSSIMEIGIAKSLMFVEDDLLTEVIKHEIAHLICFLEHGNLDRPHGTQFHDICKRYGWNESISATIPAQEVEERSKKIMNKVVKLFDLSTSSNAFEAKSALAKARLLMISNGIKILERDDSFVVMRVLEAKRTNEKIRAISEILRAFFVYPVINHGKGKVYLEIFGERSSVEIGEYIAHLLDKKFDALWKEEKHLSGIRAKTSFFQGIATGFLKEVHSTKQESGVLVIEKILMENVRMAYPHLSKSRSARSIDTSALKKGQRAGSLMKIPKGIKKSRLLGFLPLHKQ